MPRPDPSSCFSGFKQGAGIVKPPRRERPQQLACDRCRGQKLRCIRTQNPNAPCERCQKAGATCIIDSSVRMGRPKRTDNEQREGTTVSSHDPSQSMPSPTLPTSTQTASGGFTPNGETWWGQDLDDMVDPTLEGVQYMVPFDFALQDQDAALEDDSMDIPPDHYPSPTLDLSSDQSIPALTDVGATIDNTATVNVYSRFPPMRPESTRELSNLNLELYRQLGVVGPMANSYRNTQPSLVTPPEGNHTTLSDAVVFMMHGLQTYHKLLVEILGFAGPTPHDAMYDSHDNAKAGTTTTSLLSPVDGRDGDMSDEAGAGHQPQGAIRPDSSAGLTVSHDSSHNSAALLDMPTSLLLLSCHTNLVYLCRDVFAAIRAALLATRRQITLFTFSFLHIDEMSIPQDPDLQIIVLTQAVVRLTDRIGRLLGYPPDDCEAANGDGGKRRKARGTHSNAIAPQLLDFVLKGGATGGGGGWADRVGMEALRGEIRRLHELVYKQV